MVLAAFSNILSLNLENHLFHLGNTIVLLGNAEI